MSLLRGTPKPPSPFGGEQSAMLQFSSAWSAWAEVKKVPALRILAENVQLSAAPHVPSGGWAVVGDNGIIYANPLHIAPMSEWVWVLAHLLAHLGLRHSPQRAFDINAILAQELAANSLISDIGLTGAPDGFLIHIGALGARSTDSNLLMERMKSLGTPESLAMSKRWFTGTGDHTCDVIHVEGTESVPPDTWAMMLTRGLLESMDNAKQKSSPWVTVGISRPKQALAWFVDHFPLLSALAAHFQIIEDRDTAQTFNISIAAVVAERMEILINPDVELTMQELRFIMGHELMHVGLLHHQRRQNRDAFVWNLACDFVINAWLIEMGVGDMPPKGGLYNPAFAGMSANEIYDRLIKDPQYTQRLATFRGVGVGDIMPEGSRGGARRIGREWAADAADRLMKEGIEAHIKQGRGTLPAELLELVTPTYQPPPPWKMQLAKWFAAKFEPTAPARSYSRQSRRQQSTPDIPRPRYALPQLPEGQNVLGVVLDTSGSMSNSLIGQCLGVVSSLAQQYNIRQIRLVFCDAQPYDEGYVAPERLTKPMQVRGRGGTRLQPAVNLLETAKDFPKDAPLLILTDGFIERLKIEREHAFCIPEGGRLPFNPVGPVFRLK
jgi:predicted metal-dependent peptidase